MKPSDVERVADLCGQLGYPSRAEQVEARFEILRRRADEGMFVAVGPSPRAPGTTAPAAAPAENGLLVGWVHVRPSLTLESDPCAEIAGLVVAEAHRSTGVGRTLVEAAEDWAVEQGYREIRVRSNVVRERAHQFYRRLGYEVAKTQVNFRKTLRRRARP